MTQPQWLVAWAGDDQGSSVEVTATGAPAAAVAKHVPRLVEDRVASRTAQRDPSLWGPGAEAEASIRMGWVDLPESSVTLADRIERLRAELAAEGLDRIVLAGMGGPALGPEVIARCAGVPLVVLDSTDPDQIRATLATDLDRTVLVVSSKSGTTAEMDSQRRLFEAAFEAAGMSPASRIVVVTDPGSPLHEISIKAGYREVFLAETDFGGRFSALSEYGLVPSGLAGADVRGLLDSATAVMDLLADDDPGNPALVLGAALGGTEPLLDKVIFIDEDSGLPGFADWAEQLIAESTGKSGTGLLPVVVEDAVPPELAEKLSDALVVRLVSTAVEQGVDDEWGDRATAREPTADEVTVAGQLGSQMLLWEYATAIAGRLLGVNPFDQPDVESAKVAARGLLDARPAVVPPDLVDGAVELRATGGLLDGITDLPGALSALLDRLEPRGYLAVMAYLDREHDTALAAVRGELAARSGRPVTFGWGPRFLHSTGQFHKGGPAVGVYLQVTGEPGQDLAIPDQPFGFGQLIAAQAAGDAQVLAEHGRPVLRVHLLDRAAGITQLLAASRGRA